jgi:predicted metal-dependent peptidase
MGVYKDGINFYLMINPYFWYGLADMCKPALLKHEALHIAFFHLERHNEFENQKLANIAMDLEINQYIDEGTLPAYNMPREVYREGYIPRAKELNAKLEKGEITKEEYKIGVAQLPPRGVYLKDYSELNLKPKMGTRYYYDKLNEHKDDKPGDPEFCPALADMMKDCEEGIPTPCDHDWGDFENLTESEQKLMHRMVDGLLKEVAEQIKKSRGTVPGELAGYLDGLDFKEPPKFNWRAYLRRFAGGSRKVFTKKLHRKYNKRFIDQPGLKLKPLRRIMVAVDTSGSVSNEELKEFFHEIHHMMRMGTEVVVVQCDAAISNIIDYKKGHETKIAIHGRGGTSFDPPVAYYNEHRKDFSCMIYLTDGEAPAPTDKIQGPILWVLSSRSSDNPDLFPRIKLN